MAKITTSIIDNLTFYTYGRLERDIETLAERSGVLKRDFASRLSALLSGAQSGPVLGTIDQMPILPDDSSARMHVGTPALALAERPHGQGVHHEQSIQGKAARNRAIMAELMSTLTPPVRLRDFHRIMAEKGVCLDSARNVTDRMVKKGLLQKRNGMFNWVSAAEQKTNGVEQPQNGAERSGYKKRPPTLPKGEGARLVLKYMKKRQMPQPVICQHLKQKYPNINHYVWNVTVTMLVRQWKLRKWANGLITIADAARPSANGGSGHGDAATAG